MDPSRVLIQSNFFYEGVFHAEMDHTLLHSLVTQKKQQQWKSVEIPFEALKVARLAVNHYHRTQVTFKDVVNRMTHMEDRWHTFVKVANYKGCIWTYSTNYISADDKTWAKIIKMYPLGEAYRFKGEPEFHLLACLYGSAGPNKQEGSEVLIKRGGDKIVINLSSSNDVSSHNNRTVVLGEDDEVTSHVLKTTRRKLAFDEDEELLTDQFSATNEDIAHLYVRPQPHDHRFPPPNAFPRKPPFMHGSSSSCASSSPGQFNWGPFA